MALDINIKFSNGIDGESKRDGHKGEIDVLAWSWGASNSGSFHEGGGGGTGKCNVQDLSFTKWIDKSSPILYLKCCDGTHIDEVTLTCQKAGTEALVYFKIVLKKVMVTSVSTGGSGGEDRLTENVTLNFAHIDIEYQEQNEKGGKEGGAVTYKWDIEAGKSQ